MQSRVIDENRAPEESDDQARPSADYETEQGKNARGHELMSVQPHQLRVAREIGDLHKVGCVMLRANIHTRSTGPGHRTPLSPGEESLRPSFAAARAGRRALWPGAKLLASLPPRRHRDTDPVPEFTESDVVRNGTHACRHPCRRHCAVVVAVAQQMVRLSLCEIEERRRVA